MSEPPSWLRSSHPYTRSAVCRTTWPTSASWQGWGGDADAEAPRGYRAAGQRRL